MLLLLLLLRSVGWNTAATGRVRRKVVVVVVDNAAHLTGHGNFRLLSHTSTWKRNSFEEWHGVKVTISAYHSGGPGSNLAEVNSLFFFFERIIKSPSAV